MGWLRVAYRLTVGNPELNKKVTSETRALALGLMARLAGEGMQNDLQLPVMPEAVRRLGAVSIAPEVQPFMAAPSDELPKAA